MSTLIGDVVRNAFFPPRDYTKTGRASVHATRGATKANKSSARPKEHHSVISDEHGTQCVKLHLLFTHIVTKHSGGKPLKRSSHVCTHSKSSTCPF